MPVSLLIPTALRGFTEGKAELFLEGQNVKEILIALTEKYPDIKLHLFDENNSLRSFINVFLGERNIKNLQGLDTQVNQGDKLLLIPAIAGGQPKKRDPFQR